MKKPKHLKSKYGKKRNKKKSQKKHYPSDLSNGQWRTVRHLFSQSKRGRPRIWHYRRILNAIFYVLKTGCAWRFLPHELPPWRLVYGYFRNWSQSGFIERIHNILRDRLRKSIERNKSPSIGIIDSQSAKTTEQGLYPLLTLMWADGGYRGELIERVHLHLGIRLEIVKRSDDAKGFEVLPWRWIVERTLAWISRNRRMSKDYERLPKTTESWIYLAMTSLMLKRLEKMEEDKIAQIAA